MNGELLTSNLYEKVLCEPARQGFDELLIAAGYVSSAFLSLVVDGSDEVQIPSVVGDNTRLSIVYGMYPNHGVTQRDHDSFLRWHDRQNVSLHYFNPGNLALPKECHSKLYVWLKSGNPAVAFCGSVNATTAAFFADERESVTECDPVSALTYYKRIEALAQPVTDVRGLLLRTVDIRKLELLTADQQLDHLEFVDLPLTTDGKGVSVNKTSGLNWGVRPGRNQDQAYLSVPAEVGRSGFFPPRGVPFVVHADDGEQFLAARRQENGKAIHSIESNAILGEWFRRRLALANGTLVTIHHLRAFGRIFVRFYKLPTGEYLMDFRPQEPIT